MSSPRFSCTFDGRCVPDPEGTYSTEEECLRNCGASSSRDTDLIIYQYNPELAVNLASVDRIRVLKLLTGLTIPDSADGNTSVRILFAMSDFSENRLDVMCREPLLYPYLSAKYPLEDGSIELYIESLSLLPCLEALLELDRLGEFDHYLRDAAAMNTHYENDGEYAEWEFDEDGEEIAVPKDRSYRLHIVLSRASKTIDRRMLRYLEEAGHTGLIRYLMEGAPSTIQNNPDIADYLTDTDRPVYTEMIQYLQDVHPEEGLIYSSSWAILPLAEAMLRKHSHLQERVMTICQRKIELIQQKRPNTDIHIGVEYKTLKLLAQLGMPQLGNWCFVHRNVLNSVKNEDYIELCLSGLLNPIERFEAIALRRLNHSSLYNIQTPLIESIVQEAFEFRPDYIPPFEIFDYYASYRQESLYRYISDETLIAYIETEGHKWYYDDHIQSLPVARRLAIKRVIETVNASR